MMSEAQHLGWIREQWSRQKEWLPHSTKRASSTRCRVGWGIAAKTKDAKEKKKEEETEKEETGKVGAE